MVWYSVDTRERTAFPRVAPSSSRLFTNLQLFVHLFPALRVLSSIMLSSLAQRWIGRSPFVRSGMTNLRSLSTIAYTHSSSNIISPLAIDTPPTSPPAGHVSVKWLAAGIDPVDVAVATGVPSASSYGPASTPAVGGTEGVGIVTATGSGVTVMEKGDHVVPIKMGLGTWSEASQVSVTDIMRIPSSVKVELAATLPGSACTAKIILDTYCKDLKKGDSIIHTNANDSVGTSLVQLGNLKGYQMISIINDTEMDMRDYALTIERLKLQGSTIAIGSSYLKSSENIASIIPSASYIIHGGTQEELDSIPDKNKKCPSVSYCPASTDSSMEQFSLASWLQNTHRDEIEQTVLQVTQLMDEGHLSGWLKRIPFNVLPSSFHNNKSSAQNRKLVAMMD